MPRRRELHDRFFRLAKAEGYAARSAYKLTEINSRTRIMRRGDCVLDLGCAPGSWLQVAAELVGDSGRVVGLDLQPVTIPLPQTVTTFVGDIFAFDALALREPIRETQEAPSNALEPEAAEPPLYDAVISDMAPSTTGAPVGDHFRSVALGRRVMELLPGLLAPGGCLTMKVFEGEEYPTLLREVQRLFAEAKGLKPRATREVSREMYIIARGYHGVGPERRTPPSGPARREAMPRVAPPRPAPGAGWGKAPATKPSQPLPPPTPTTDADPRPPRRKPSTRGDHRGGSRP